MALRGLLSRNSGGGSGGSGGSGGGGIAGRLSALRERVVVREEFLWLIPIFVAAAFYVLTEKQALEVIGACLALLLLVFMVNRPTGTLVALVIFLPSEAILFGLLYRWHIPGTFLRQASGIKELMALSLLLAGLRAIRDGEQRLDRIDFAVLAYVGVVTIYLIVPHLFSELAPTQWSPRFLAWRTDAAYPLLFLGVRHAPISSRLKERFVILILSVGGFIAAVGLYQKIDPNGFTNFVLNTARVAIYETNVLVTPSSVVMRDLAYIYATNPLHISSILLSPYDLGDYLTMVAAVAAVRISHHHRSVMTYLVFAASAACIFFTQVRADGEAIVIILVLVALPASRGPVEGRIRLIAALGVAAILVVPNLAGSRYVGNQAANVSSIGHIQEISDGIQVIYYEPLGLGLGEQPGVANRYPSLTQLVDDGDISDNMITQVGDELGIQALIPWLVMMILIGLELKRRASKGDVLAASMGFAFLGIVIAGQSHHVFLTFPVPWTLWAGVGLALSVNHADVQEEPTLEAISYPSAPGVR
jgi:hypothetical protein